MYAPKVFTQVLFKIPAAADAAALIIAMVNRQVKTTLPDLKCGCLAALVTHAPSCAHLLLCCLVAVAPCSTLAFPLAPAERRARYNASVFIATMLKRDTAAVLRCLKSARPGNDGRTALCLIVEQVPLVAAEPQT
jgi:hypothetical protein